MRSEQGFTLVELLAALVVGSVLIGFLSVAIASLARQSRAVNDSRQLDDIIRSGHLLRSYIASAEPGESTFDGSANRLTMTVPPPLSLGPAGPLRLRLAVRRAGSSASIVAQFEPALPWVELPAAAKREVVLVEGLQDAHFSYERDEGAPVPRLVAVSIVDRTGRQVDIAQAPKRTDASDCVFDPISLACRR